MEKKVFLVNEKMKRAVHLSGGLILLSWLLEKANILTFFRLIKLEKFAT